MEGNTYQCDWEKKRKKYTVWVVEDPNIKGVGSSFSEAEDVLYENICLSYGDGEGVTEYVRELPDSEFPREYATPFFYRLTPSVWIPTISNLSDLYSGGYCEACNSGLGERSSIPIVVEEFPPEGDSLMLVKGSLMSGFTLHVVVVSKKLSDQLNLELDFTLREVTSKVKSRKKYFEVMPKSKSQSIDGVAVSSKEERLGDFWGWKCNECGNSESFYYSETHLNYLVPLAALDNQSLFIVDGALAVKGNLWRQVIDRIKVKKVSAVQLGFTSERNIRSNPDFKVRTLKGE